MLTIAPCLWFNDNAEEVVEFYSTVFKNFKKLSTTYYGKTGFETHGHKDGVVLTIDFSIDDQKFTALNGGPEFKFTEALSLQIFCRDQAEVDYYWEKLTEGGDPAAQQCGWLKDKFGVSWQVVPEGMEKYVGKANSEQSDRAMTALLSMKKLDIAELKKAYEGV
jgi:predicted 3-demethylubiquinone-9 3-methyltransferase (glyoxalase superfamily)